MGDRCSWDEKRRADLKKAEEEGELEGYKGFLKGGGGSGEL